MKKNESHWMYNTRLYHIWENLKQRCNNPKANRYKFYWWKWVIYDEKWETFLWFYADVGEWYSENLTIDRIDNDWNYCKENCRWITNTAQQWNKSNNIMYKWKCLAYWCRKHNLKHSTVRYRLLAWKTWKVALELI
jgi:hypothetical protein